MKKQCEKKREQSNSGMLTNLFDEFYHLKYFSLQMVRMNFSSTLEKRGQSKTRMWTCWTILKRKKNKKNRKGNIHRVEWQPTF